MNIYKQSSLVKNESGSYKRFLLDKSLQSLVTFGLGITHDILSFLPVFKKVFKMTKVVFWLLLVIVTVSSVYSEGNEVVHQRIL